MIGNNPNKTIRLKEFKLVEAAKKLIYNKGYSDTTLSLIAEEAKVPLGNVYYYFKTKDDIAKSVIESYENSWKAHYGSWDKLAKSHKDRLSMFIRYMFSEMDIKNNYGCPIGSLCYDLINLSNDLAQLMKNLLHSIYKWVALQFQYLGCGANSNRHAMVLISHIQGSAILMHSQSSYNLIDCQIKYLEDYLQNIKFHDQNFAEIDSDDAEKLCVNHFNEAPMEINAISQNDILRRSKLANKKPEPLNKSELPNKNFEVIEEYEY